MSADLNSRFGLNPAHSEVVAASQLIQPCAALDMGCGTGRNSLYLSSLGFDVSAVDANPNAIGMLNSFIAEADINNISTQVYDINDANLNGSYGFIACTVTLMFLDPNGINNVIADMQNSTVAGGYNLIVCAMDTAEYPCPINFPFTFKPGELSAAYNGWELIKYNEDLGTMHNGARLQFATMLARKV